MRFFLAAPRQPAFRFSGLSTVFRRGLRQLSFNFYRFRDSHNFSRSAAAGQIVCVPIGPFGLAFWRDLVRLETEIDKQRYEITKAREDMQYARSVNAELGERNTRLIERNSYLEWQNRGLEARNHDLEARNPDLEAENLRLKEQNHWLFFSANLVRKAACDEVKHQNARP
jgi:hypothetical protein